MEQLCTGNERRELACRAGNERRGTRLWTQLYTGRAPRAGLWCEDAGRGTRLDDGDAHRSTMVQLCAGERAHENWLVIRGRSPETRLDAMKHSAGWTGRLATHAYTAAKRVEQPRLSAVGGRRAGISFH